MAGAEKGVAKESENGTDALASTYAAHAGKCRGQHNGEETRNLLPVGVTETESHVSPFFHHVHTRRRYYVYREGVYTVTLRYAEDLSCCINLPLAC